MTEASSRDRYLAPGTRVALLSRPDAGPEQGVVIHCWGNDEIDAYDCYVAFFGVEMLPREPAVKPYVLRYAASSLKVVEPSPHALMLRDTVLELKKYLSELSGNTDFDRGYTAGFDFATRTLKHQCEVFGLRDDLGWMEPDLATWLRSDD